MHTPTNSRFSGLRRSISALTVLLAVGLPTVSAVSFADIQLGGFISQGYVQSWGNNQPFEAKGGTFDYREYAVNASYASGNYRVGAQVFGQSLGNYGEDRPILDWAILDYQFNRSFGVRVGRVKFPKGLYGEALDVDAIRPFALLPASIYNPVMRDFSSSFDGGMVYGNLALGGAGSVDYKAFYGDIQMDPDQGVADFFNTTSLYAASGVTDVGIKAVIGTQLMWNTPVIGLRLGYSFNQLQDLFANGPFIAFPAATTSLTTEGSNYHTVSAEYLYGDWTFAAEAQRFYGDFVISNPFVTSQSQVEWLTWYASAARRITDDLLGR